MGPVSEPRYDSELDSSIGKDPVPGPAIRPLFVGQATEPGEHNPEYPVCTTELCIGV